MSNRPEALNDEWSVWVYKIEAVKPDEVKCAAYSMGDVHVDGDVVVAADGDTRHFTNARGEQLFCR